MKKGQTRFIHPPPRRTEHLSPNMDKEPLRAEALKRRAAILSAGLHTYTLGYKLCKITCLCCGLTSPNSGDVHNRYCSFCCAFHDDVLEVKT